MKEYDLEVPLSITSLTPPRAASMLNPADYRRGGTAFPSSAKGTVFKLSNLCPIQR